MQRLILKLVYNFRLLGAGCTLLFACNKGPVDESNLVSSDAGGIAVDVGAFDNPDTGRAAIIDAGSITMSDAGGDNPLVDAGPDPTMVPILGPIPPPAGTSTVPESGDFVWTGVGFGYLGSSIPSRSRDWDEYPRYGVASLLSYSDNGACVCYDSTCETCSQVNCGRQACSYEFNQEHKFNKYHVQLRSLENQALAVEFEVNISLNPPITYTDISDVLNRLERVPPVYWRGLKIITKFGRGIQFFHSSYFNGAAAYGSRSYIDTQTANLPTLLHELGHTFEQYTRLGDEPILEPQSNILNPIWRHAIRVDDIRTSRYGNGNEWEDLAEFARIYALAVVEGRLDELQMMSPERYRIWQRILSKGLSIIE
ncbi:MAG: hypothetical protein VYC39_08845 [Myxococcota bacterium]|nr:hypothetical protein [Myxococcota bacterium]